MILKRSYQIKATQGITGFIFWLAHIKFRVWHLDVGLSFPKCCSLDSWWECSSQFKVRELGSKRCKSVWSLSVTKKNYVLFSQYARTSNKQLKRNSVRQLITVNSKCWTTIKVPSLVHACKYASWVRERELNTKKS